MSNFQKYARFHLIVVFAALMAVIALYLNPVTSPGYIAGFSILGLLGFGEFYYQRAGKKPIADERDEQINHRSVLIAYTVFWVCFVAWGVLTTMKFSSEGSIPLGYVEPVVWIALCLVVIVRSTVVLALSRQDS
ncbi:MAG: DUF2178 domain-containing protein [bacterium]|nr:DUF2178 domain-containing protein [bacterium]